MVRKLLGQVGEDPWRLLTLQPETGGISSRNSYSLSFTVLPLNMDVDFSPELRLHFEKFGRPYYEQLQCTKLFQQGTKAYRDGGKPVQPGGGESGDCRSRKTKVCLFYRVLLRDILRISSNSFHRLKTHMAFKTVFRGHYLHLHKILLQQGTLI